MTSVAPPRDPRRWKALAVLALVQFMLIVDTTAVNVALPSIRHSLGFSASGLAWVVNGYALMAGGLVMLGGRASDLIGRRRLFLIGVGVFAVASACSGAAQSPTMLVTSRLGQGVGEAMASPAAFSIVALLFLDPNERTKALGIWGAIAGLGGILGVLISGVLTELVSWRAIFFVNLLIAAAALIVLPRLTPESRVARARKLDWPGAILITAGLLLLVDGLLAAARHPWSSRDVLPPLVAGAALLVGFVTVQARSRDPLVPLRFFSNRTRVTANLATMCLAASFVTMFFALTLYLQGVHGFSALQTGLGFAPFAVAMIAGIAASTKLLPLLGVRFAVTAAFLLAGGGLLFLGAVPVTGSFAVHVLPGILAVGFGAGIAYPPLGSASMHDVSEQDAGLGSGVQSTVQQVGGSLGLAVLVTIALRHAASQAAAGAPALSAATAGYALAFRVAGILMLAGALAVAVLFERGPVPPGVTASTADPSPTPAASSS